MPSSYCKHSLKVSQSKISNINYSKDTQIYNRQSTYFRSKAANCYVSNYKTFPAISFQHSLDTFLVKLC